MNNISIDQVKPDAIESKREQCWPLFLALRKNARMGYEGVSDPLGVYDYALYEGVDDGSGGMDRNLSLHLDAITFILIDHYDFELVSITHVNSAVSEFGLRHLQLHDAVPQLELLYRPLALMEKEIAGHEVPVPLRIVLNTAQALAIAASSSTKMTWHQVRDSIELLHQTEGD